MQCVHFDDRLPNGFEEHFYFSPQMPYTVSIKHFQTEDIVPLHYAETLELLMCENLCGEIVVDNRHYTLGGQQVFVIPPYTVHCNSVQPCEGTMYVFKISFQEMNRYFNVDNFLAVGGLTLSQLRYDCPEYPAVREIMGDLIAQDGNLLLCLAQIVKLFVVLSRHVEVRRELPSAHSRFRSSSLQDLIRWTHENYARRITIEEAAAITGYSKYHFCSRFKAQTGMTYMNYLSSVRMSYARLMLRNGETVQAVCRSCGFENTSHFIQTFKRIQGTTPHQYAAQQKRLNP